MSSFCSLTEECCNKVPGIFLHMFVVQNRNLANHLKQNIEYAPGCSQDSQDEVLNIESSSESDASMITEESSSSCDEEE